MLNANDHKYPENIKGYGRCKADAQEVRRLLQQHGNVTIDTNKYAGRTCYLILNEAWQNGDTHFTVEGAPALLDTSTLVCARGGRIRFIKPGSDADALPDSIDASYSAFDGINSELEKVEAVIANYLPKNGHFTIGDKKDGFYAEATLNPVDAEHRETEGSLGTKVFGGERYGRIRNGVWRNKDKRGGKKE